VSEVRASGLDVRDWLHAYLGVSLLPMIDIFARDGVGFEAHLQNSLLITEGGRPVGFRVRDMEGTHVDRDRPPPGLDPASPLLYDGEEAWQRFRYHGVVNQLAGVIGTLGHHLGDERALWAVVADALREVAASSGPAAGWAHDLLTSATLPAKANLLSRFAQRGELPLYVALPNPIREADRC
jgi:siderophore synthetase component